MTHAQPTQSNELPAEAFQFLATSPPVSLAEVEAGKGRRFEGIAYSGELVTGHGYWRAVIFDLSSLRFAERIPALVDHDTRQRAGWAELSVESGQVVARGALLANMHGEAVSSDSLGGFPWQMSVGIHPGRIEEIEAGAESVINGHTVRGPAVVFRDATVAEVSFVPNGADSKTSARAFSRGTAAPPKEAETMAENNGNAERIAALESQVQKMAADHAATLTALTEERDAAVAAKTEAEKALAEFRASARRAEVEGLFAAIGREVTDAAVAPYLEMPAEQFSAVSADLRAARPSGGPGALGDEVATDGNGEKFSAADLATKARKYHAEQHAAGNPISFAAAVAAVKPKE